MIKKILLPSAGAVLVLAVIIGSGALDSFFSNLFLPQKPFNPEELPLPPDYSLGSSWVSHPKFRVLTWYVPPNIDFGRSATSAFTESKEKEFNAFYVHPTSYFFDFPARWNAPIDNVLANHLSGDVPMKEQASVFNDVADVYAPRYRQCSQGAQDGFPLEEHQPAMDVAYSDVKDAFNMFLKENAGKPFFIASHSQGTLHAMRLLQEWLPTASEEQADLLVAAYLIGNTVPEEEMTGILPVCEEASQTKCYLSYNIIIHGDEEAEKHWKNKGSPTCVNPLSWKHNGALVASEDHLGALPVCMSCWGRLPLIGRFIFPRPHSQLVNAQCKEGILHVSDPMDKEPAYYWFQPGIGLHAYDFQLFYVNIKLNIFDRATQWMKMRAR
uniref:DUF3089 domain-containing protein n=1 Tax=Ditylum brightwellii TaxID=49249 RepID=A0A7S4RR21_9STRA